MTEIERAELQRHLDTLDGLRALVGNVDGETWGRLWDESYVEAIECANRILANGDHK